jgi:hypothetical protein
MPRTKKAAGTAVDRRNGRSVTLEAAAGGALAKFPLPKRSDGLAYDVRSRRMYAALWADPVSSALSLVDRELVIRWVESVDSWIKALISANEDPVTTGSMRQEVPSPWFAIAKQHLDAAVGVEQQLGVGALNRARLGLTIGQARKTLQELNADLDGEDDDDDDDDDPRLG